MKRSKKHLSVLIVFVFLGAITGVTVQSKTILSQKVSIKAVKTLFAMPTAVIHEPTPIPESQSLRTRILFTGDINLGRCIAKRTLSAHTYTNNYNYPFEFVADELRAADITVGSLDGSLSDESPPMPCPNSMNLIGPTKMAEGLQFSGFDVASIATNHIKDCGEKGFNCDNKAILDTINTLNATGIQAVGGGSNLMESRLPIVVERNGIRFAFLGINQIDERVWAGENTPGTAPLSRVYIDKIKAEITSARQIADVVIVLPHWGVEYTPEPQDNQRVWAQESIDAGASLVVGNHPHIIQPMEVYSDKLIFYALGNFVFDQEHDFQRESIVVEVNFVGTEIESWELHPININYFTLQPHWAENAEAEYILARVKRE